MCSVGDRDDTVEDKMHLIEGSNDSKTSRILILGS